MWYPWGLHSCCLGWGFHLMFVPVALLCRATTSPANASKWAIVLLFSYCQTQTMQLVPVVVMTKHWWRCSAHDELQMWEMVKVKEYSQWHILEGRGGGWRTLWCVSSFKITALCLKALLWLPLWEEGREMVIWCHSYGNVLIVEGSGGQGVRLQLSESKHSQAPSYVWR